MINRRKLSTAVTSPPLCRSRPTMSGDELGSSVRTVPESIQTAAAFACCSRTVWNIQPDVSSAMTSTTPTARVGYWHAQEV
jgi:hypothetical protein